MGRGRERHRGARRIFIEDVEHDLAGQALARAAAAVLGKEMLGPVEDARDPGVVQRIDGEKVHEHAAYCGPERLASASIAPWRMCAAASASIFSARLARLTSASIIARSTACVDQRSSHSRIGNASGARLRAKAR